MRRFESEFIQFVESSYGGILKNIAERRLWTTESRRKSKKPWTRSRNASWLRLAAPAASEGFVTNEHGHTPRFPATHPLGKEHAADHACDEVCCGGATAARAGSGACCAAVCEGIGACCARSCPALKSPSILCWQNGRSRTILVIVLSGERGLAGAFNSNILRKAAEFIRSRGQENCGHSGRQKRPRLAEEGGISVRCGVRERAGERGFQRGAGYRGAGHRAVHQEKIDAVYIVFSEFKSVPRTWSWRNFCRWKRSRRNAGREVRQETQIDYIYEQPEEQLLRKLLPRYIETQVLRSMLESSAAEYAARMVAMDSATKNAGDVIEA